MSSLDTQYNEIMQSVRSEEANRADKETVTDGFHRIPEYEHWTLHQTQFDGMPYIKFTCAGCKTIWTTTKLELEIHHCHDVSTMPKELSQRLEALQIKLGIRVQTFVDGLLGKSRPASAPAPNLNAF